MASVMLVGAGAIGSQVLPHLARSGAISRITVVDPGTYDADNLGCQQIFTADIGKPKAHVQAQRVWQINPAVAERAIQRRVETLPLGWLRADVIVSAVDSRRARMAINRAAWQLGVPWVDAGVHADGMLARVSVYRPGPDVPCFECAFDDRDYALVEQAYPCGAGADAPATGASSGLGALAAALLAIEVEKLLAGDEDHLLSGRQVLVDARHHRSLVTSFRRLPTCRMPDHERWEIAALTLDLAATTLDDLESYSRSRAGDVASIGVANQLWAVGLTCDACGSRTSAAAVVREGTHQTAARCACGGSRRATGFDLRDHATFAELAGAGRGRSLSSLGLLVGDVLTFVSSAGQHHAELVDPRAAARSSWPAFDATGAQPLAQAVPNA